MTGELDTRYSPRDVEARWYQFWEQEGLFAPALDSNVERPVFSMVIPPPNVTGVLHLGHALNNTWQDILARYHRMRGDSTLWLPGTDHAGIATQVKVDELIRSRGQTREGLGREAFVAEVWAWREKYGYIILDQLRKLGCSVDWSRTRFTLDEGLSEAVTEVFVRLYEEGLLYRGEYITNWCVSCQTAISDIEVEHTETPGRLWHIRYALETGDGFLEVATTRPETMLGDTALAVNPDDPRYRDFVGRRAVVPLMDRVVPIVADSYVDPEFGTGVVKVTPAHDPNDFAIGERHQLPRVKVIGEDGVMTTAAGPYAGLMREAARDRVLADLKHQGLLVREEPLVHSVGHCEKCDTVIEPLVSLQWFVKMRPLAEPALDAVESGAVEFVPERFSKVYRNWLLNIHDWCVSRQIWWGHRIPAYYCDTCHAVMVSREAPTQCPTGHGTIRQDADVLDTWFSSALWPFSTLGWPHQTEDLQRFYPTSVLSTGYDIIFFWVSRMIMQGLHFTGTVPFRTALLHGLVRDAEGRKMSKSLGNGIDPVEVIDQYGADALRMSLIQGNAPGNDLRFSETKVEAAQHLANKIWNATRFVRLHLDEMPVEAGPLRSADHWILRELDRTADEMGRFLDQFEFGEAARSITEFFWNQYCDWYIEMVKGRLTGEAGIDRDAARYTLWKVADRALKLLHPFMPFVTEELWQALPHQGKSIMVAAWPVAEGGYSEQLADDCALSQEAIRTIRNLRAEVGLPPGQRVAVTAVTDDEGAKTAWDGNRAEIVALARLSDLAIVGPGHEPHPAIAGISAGGSWYLPLLGVVDVSRERQRLEKNLETVEKETARLESRLGDATFRAKAPAEVVRETEERAQETRAKAVRLAERLRDLS